MKITGILLLFCSVSAIGFEVGNKYISLIKDIERSEIFLKNIILCLENENMTIMEVFEICAAVCDKKTKNFVYQLQKNGINNISETALKCDFCRNKNVLPVLNEAFSVFGKYSSAEQIREIVFCRNKLKNILHEQEKALLSNAKLSRYSGVLAGAFLSIILI